MSKDPLADVRTTARKFQTAAAKRDAAYAALLEVVREADEQGEVRAHIIQASGLARQTVYNAWAEEQAG